MANITLLGASYTDVPAVTLPQTGGGTVTFYENGGGGGTDVVVFSLRWDSNYTLLSSSCNKTFSECFNMVDSGNATALVGSTWDVDLTPWESNSSATEVDYGDNYIKYVVFSGVVPWADITYHSDGQIDFSEPSAYSSNLEATHNGYYGMDNGGVYVDATVNVPQPWTLITTQEVVVSTTETSAKTAATISCGSAISTKDKIIWVHIRDTAGKRAGYFYGSDSFFINTYRGNGSTTTFAAPACEYIRVSTSGAYTGVSGQYGVWGYSISSAGALIIRRRYNSTNTLTIDGTFRVSVYTLDLPDGLTLFD